MDDRAISSVSTLLPPSEGGASTTLSSEERAALSFASVRRSAREDSHSWFPDDDDDDDFETLVGDEIMLDVIATSASSTFCSPEQEEGRWGRFKLEGGDICDDDE